MAFRIGINGFGRIGRLATRIIAAGKGPLVITHINDPALEPAQAAHLLAFDSVHGRWPHSCEAHEDGLLLAGHKATFSRERDPVKVGWEHRVDLIIDCTGRLKKLDDIEAFLAAGVPRVLVSQPVDGIPNIVMGVNDGFHNLSLEPAACAASCTTNCLAPVARVVHEVFTITRGFVTTIHGLTNDQALLDQGHDDWRRGRAAGASLIPTTSGFARAIGRVLPELEGRLEGYAVRAPVTNASMIDCVFQVNRPTSVAGVNLALEAAAAETLRSILAAESRPLVSADFRGDTHSATVDLSLTQVLDSNLIKVVAWYDNETGYSHRLTEVAVRMAGL
ncbi:MAG: gap [Moraxellaceae bacterium]|jgi:glyceraldehyde 3-phosphate dehydrogenase|nr:gap [Moraxellaceae bacterium]